MALSKEKKEQLRIDFEAGEISIGAICKKHSVSRTTIIRLEKKYKWSREKRHKKADPKPKRRRGRPTKYRPEYAKIVTPLAMIGYSEEKIAGYFGVNRDTILEWKKVHPEFSGGILDGRTKATAKVVVSLFQRATGYSHPEDKIFNNNGEPLVVSTTKHYPPEYKSIALWLKNKEPELWKDKQEIEGSFEAKVGKISKDDAQSVQDLFDEIIQND